METQQDDNEQVLGMQAVRGLKPPKYLPSAYKQALGIASRIDSSKGTRTFDAAYAQVKAEQKGIIDIEAARGLLAKYYENLKKVGRLDDATYQAYTEGRGIPTTEQMKELLPSSTDRMTQGLGKVFGQTMYGVGELDRYLFGSDEASDTRQQERKEAVKGYKGKEALWKAYNSSVNMTADSGLDLPFNVLGGVGESVPYIATGLGASALFSKAATQAAGSIVLDSIVDTARFQEHEDIVEYATGLGSNLVGNVVGLKLGNYFRGTSAEQLNTSATTLRDLDTSSNGFRLLSEGKVTASNTAVSNPAAAEARLLKTGNKQRQQDIAASILDTQKTGRVLYDDSLQMIGKGAKELEAEVPNNWAYNPVGYKIREFFDSTDAMFKAKAKPFREAYRAAGDNYNIDVTELMDSADYGIVNPSARGHLQKAINTLKKTETPESSAARKEIATVYKDAPKLNKRISDLEKIAIPTLERKIANTKELLATTKLKFGELPRTAKPSTVKAKRDRITALEGELKTLGPKANNLYNEQKQLLEKRGADRFKLDRAEAEDMFDVNNISANDLDDVIKIINQDMFQGAGAMQGAMTPATKVSLLDWVDTARTKLSQLPPEYSTNYQKANELYAANFKLVQEDPRPGRGSPFKGIQNALEDSSGRKLTEMFTGADALHNINNLGKAVSSDNPLYGQIVRNYLETKMSPDMTKSSGLLNQSPFNFDLYRDSVKDLDWDGLRRVLPNNEAVDNLAGIEGLANSFRTEKALLTNPNVLDNLDDVSTMNPLKGAMHYITDVADELGDTTGVFKPWWKQQESDIFQQLDGLYNKTKAPGSRDVIYEGPGAEYKKLNDLRLKQRSDLNLPEDVTTIEVNAPMLEKLYNPKYDLEY